MFIVKGQISTLTWLDFRVINNGRSAMRCTSQNALCHWAMFHRLGFNAGHNMEGFPMIPPFPNKLQYPFPPALHQQGGGDGGHEEAEQEEVRSCLLGKYHMTFASFSLSH